MHKFLLISEAVKNCAEALAILIGGGWAFWRFCLRHEGKPALDIALTTTTIPEASGSFLACFDVTLTNKSARRVLARTRKAAQPGRVGAFSTVPTGHWRSEKRWADEALPTLPDFLLSSGS